MILETSILLHSMLLRNSIKFSHNLRSLIHKGMQIMNSKSDNTTEDLTISKFEAIGVD